MRVLVFVLIIAGLVAGFLPRPLVTPEWRTPYEKALAETDCPALRRLLDIQIITHNQPAWFEIVGALEQNEICGASRIPDKNYDFIATHMYEEPGIVLRSRASSFLWPHVNMLRARSNNSANPIIRAAQIRSRKNYYACVGHFGPILAYPDYTLMAYALEHDEIGIPEIGLIAFQQTSACTAKMLGESLVMLNAAKNAEDYKIALDSAAYHAFLFSFAPGIGDEIWEIIETLPDETKAENEWAIGLIQSQSENYLKHTMECQYPSVQTLTGAIACANKSASVVAENPLAAIYAAYFTQRARRLGWQDISNAEAISIAALSPECLAAVTALENEHAAIGGGPRRFEVLSYPNVALESPDCSYLQPEPQY